MTNQKIDCPNLKTRDFLPLPFEARQSYHAYLTMITLKIRSQVDALSRYYAEQILSQKTRTVLLLGRKCEPQVMYTFLGFELKLGPKRLTCPDMTTARYLRIFGRLGATSIEIPYDPTRTAGVLPRLEELTGTIDRLLAAGESEGPHHQRRVQRIYRQIRQQLKAAELQSKRSRGENVPDDTAG